MTDGAARPGIPMLNPVRTARAISLPGALASSTTDGASIRRLRRT
ncbi:hypothetical protein [Streptomyces sp. NPDC001100]